MAETSRAKRALAALRAADQTGMGRVAGGMGAEATDRLADLDACTLDYRVWSPVLVPGLLQTPAYTAGAIKGRTPSLDGYEVGLRTQHRRWRSDQFWSRRSGLPADAWFLVGELAITRPLMNAHAHGDQLRRLLELSELDNVVIQVLREDSPAPGLVEPFEVFNLEVGPRVGHIESLIGGWYTVAAEDISRLHGSFLEMAGYALGARDSRDYIKEVLDACWEPTVVPTSSSQATVTRPTASTSPALPPAPSE